MTLRADLPVALPPRLNLSDPVALDDPYPYYRQLRAAGPLVRAGPGIWAVTRHAEASALLRDGRVGSEFPDDYHRASAGDGPVSEFFQRIVLYRDPPSHTRLRRLIGSALAPRLVGSLAGRVADLATRLIDEMTERGVVDVIAELAFPLPVMVASELLGVPAQDRDVIRPWVLDLAGAFAPIVPNHARAAADLAVIRLREYFDSLLEQRREAPRDDLLSIMLTTQDGVHRLTPQEIVDNAVFTLFAGFETTVNLIGTGCALLLQHPAALETLRRDPALVPRAIEEFLRFDAPIQGVARRVREPLDIGGRTLHQGRVVLVLIGSANHDESVFKDPERLDVTREPNPHLSFGAGAHACLGAQLARLEGSIVFTQLVRRFARFEPAGAAFRRRDSTLRAYAAVPVRVQPA